MIKKNNNKKTKLATVLEICLLKGHLWPQGRKNNNFLEGLLGELLAGNIFE